MFIKIMLNYLLGYVNIVVEGYFIERFINICISKKILLWSMKRKKSSILISNISISDFKKIRKVAKLTKCRVKINSKKGLPILFNKYRKRKIFFVFLVLIFIGIIVLSNYVWNIEIRGNEKVSNEEIMQCLKNNNFEIGVNKNKIDTKQIINNIRFNIPEIAWVGIDIEGTNAIFEIVEVEKKPEIVAKDEYCNIIAEKPGIITKINAQNGTAQVKVGDIVKEGTVLIAGWMEGKYTGTRYVHSIGEVEAKVWYSKKEKINFIQQENYKTGREENKFEIKFKNFQINLYKRVSKFEKYDTINSVNNLKIFSNYYLPIQINKITNYETEIQEVVYAIEEIKEKWVTKIEDELKNEIINKDNIVNKQINYYEGDNFLNIEVIYEVIENIGINEKLIN